MPKSMYACGDERLESALGLCAETPGCAPRVNQGLLAQVVHIDLGIAFEQGRFLNTPELVPFRLTRNVVDGMGAAGDSSSATGSAESCNNEG